MNIKSVFAFAIGTSLILAAYPAGAQQDTSDEVLQLRKQIEALSRRVDELSKGQAAVPAGAAALQAKESPPTKEPYVPTEYALHKSHVSVGDENLSVALYGIISAGVEKVSNAGGHPLDALVSGPQQGSRFGTRVFWKTGDTSTALAVMEGGFSVVNGSLSGSKIYGRQAYVGMTDTHLGTLTAGRQNTAVAQNLWWAESATAFATFGAHVGDNDDLFGDIKLNNSLVYQTSPLKNLSLSAQYAFTNATGSLQNNTGMSFGGAYDMRESGQGLRIGAGAIRVKNPLSPTNATNGAADSTGYGFSSPFLTSPVGKKAGVEAQYVGIAGMTYTAGRLTVGGDYGATHFTYLDATNLKLNNAEVFATYFLTPKLMAGLGVMDTWGKYSANGVQPSYKQVNTGFDYLFNEYIDVFLVDNYQRASGNGVVAWIYSLGPSTTQTQNAYTAGIRAKF